MYNVFIDGASGTTGLRIKDRLANRDDINILNIEESKRKDETEIKRLINDSDVTFLCLPDHSALRAAKLLDSNNKHTIIIDASTVHRIDDDWAYGFPEISPQFREKIQHNQLIANPGCYASGFIAIAYPLISHGLISNDTYLNIFAFSGYSGGGKKAIADYENKDRDEELDAPRIYALDQNHKHLPEIINICNLKHSPIFIPSICPYESGMLVSVPLYFKDFSRNISREELIKFYIDYYKDCKTINVHQNDPNQYMNANAFAGRDDMEIGVYGNGSRIVITSRFDNLGKGASGAAIQCMNLALGEDEYKSLILGDCNE